MSFTTIDSDETVPVSTKRQLGQERHNDCDVHIVYTAPTGAVTEITHIGLCNTGTASAKVSVFKSDSGQVMTQATAILWKTEIDIGGVIHLADEGFLQAGGIIGYKQLTANAITITVDGIETI